MTAQEIKELPLEEKLRIMEALWEDLRDRFESGEVPQDHKSLLDARRARAESGESRIHDWDEAKSTIGRR